MLSTHIVTVRNQPLSENDTLMDAASELVWCVSFRTLKSVPDWDCKALPYSHLCCTKYAARHAGVWVMPSCFPDGGVQCVAAMGAGRLDWKLQDTALLRK